MPEISIIVPIYNAEPYIHKCINSILNQTFKDFELILVDDGSPDNCPEICDEYEKKDKRIKVIHQRNQGASVARNMGLDCAQGEYIGFVDSDNFIHPKMYEILYQKIKKFDEDLVICQFAYTDVKGNLILDKNKSLLDINEINLGKELLKKLFDENGVALITVWNRLYKKRVFEKLRFKVGKIYEDEFLAHTLLYNCKNVIYCSQILYYYV